MQISEHILKRTILPKRIIYIDILRTFAILAVIMLHCISGFFTNAGIYGTLSWNAINILNTLTRTAVSYTHLMKCAVHLDH